ncbi:BRCT domain-containing protein [Latilactobacillus fragifolii]|uniref:BRCT domain-containing protein n=1 Tax=Latilactobacillus fragifolii TaxID=2814244 RepID=UPI001ABB4B73|nr:BRCT domain-containing protein [Latilactobacillus fragifolii]
MAIKELTQRKIIFTGTLQSLKRKDAKALATMLGAQVQPSMNQKLDYVVVGAIQKTLLDESSTKKLTYANITEKQFLEWAAYKLTSWSYNS